MSRSPQSQPSSSCVVSTVSPASQGVSRPEPRRRTPRSTKLRLLDEQKFAVIEAATTNLLPLAALDQTIQSLAARVEMLRAGKGGRLFVTDSVFELNGPWVPGHLGLNVDEQHGEVRREGYRMPIHFVVPSLEWLIFLAAWNGGACGCSVEQWERRDRMLKVKDREKSIRRNVNDKLKRLGIRLKPRRPPRFVELTRKSDVT